MKPVKGLNLHIYPSIMVGESRLLRFSSCLQESGLFARTEIVGKSGAGLLDEETLGEGRFIVRLPGRSQVGPVHVKAVSTLAWWVAIIFHYARKDVSTVAAHNVWSLPVCWLLSKLRGATYVYNPHELETETPTMRGPKQFIARIVERAFAPRAMLVTAVNPSIANWYATHLGVTPVSIRNIPVLSKDRQTTDLRQLFHVQPDGLLFVHTGRLVAGRSIPAIVSAFQTASPHHVLFLGDGPLLDSIRNAADECPRIHWQPPVHPMEVVEYIDTADAAFCLIELESTSYRYSSPNKLFEGILAGLPVVCTDLVEAKRLYGDAFDLLLIEQPDRDLEAKLASWTGASWAEIRTKVGRPLIGTWTEESRALVTAYSSALSRKAT